MSMKKNLLATLFIIVIGAAIITAKANRSRYTLDYAPDSPIKEISFKNTELRLAVYSNGVPKGYQLATTDEQGSFALIQHYPPPLAIQVLSIKGQEEFKAICQGVLSPNESTIEVTCFKEKN